MTWFVAFIGSLAGFIFGYDEGIIAGSIPMLVADFHLTPAQEGTLTSALPFGALLGSMLIGIFLASSLVEKFGRKPCIITAGILLIMGGLGDASASMDIVFVFFRFMNGIALGITMVSAPLYLSETAPANIRGAIVSSYQLAVTLGILCAYFINYLLVDYHAWRIMFASGVIPCLLMTVGILFLPESPRWLLSTGQEEKAIKALKRLRKAKGVKQELIEIELTLADEPHKHCWKPLFQKKFIPILLLGTGLFALQQLSGIDVVIYYAPEIFKLLNFSSIDADYLATLGVGSINTLATLFAIYDVDRMGRRKLLILGLLGICFSLSILFLISFFHNPIFNYFSILALAVYIISFAISLGPVPYIIMSEIFPLYIRGAGMSLSSLTNWGFNGMMVFSFPILINHIGINGLFAIYAVICLIGLILITCLMPETKGISLEKIELYLMKGKPLKELGR